MAITKLIADSITSGAIANTPYFRATLSSGTSLANETVVKVNFDTVDFQSAGGVFDTSNYKFTVSVAGVYFVSASLADNSGSSQPNKWISHIYKNGSAIIKNYSVGRNLTSTVVSSILNLSVNDYLEVYALQDTGSTQTVETDNDRTWFLAYKLI